MGKLAHKFKFVDFKDVCSNCRENCCTRFYAVLLPEEEEEFKDTAFEVETQRGKVKCIGSRDGKPCPYLSREGYCTVYEKRPLDCRIWPVVVYVDFKTGERVVYLDLECPAVREGKIPSELIERITSTVKEIDLSDEWLEKYTLAPWPNNFIEIFRFKQVNGEKEQEARLPPLEHVNV